MITCQSVSSLLVAVFIHSNPPYGFCTREREMYAYAFHLFPMGKSKLTPFLSLSLSGRADPSLVPARPSTAVKKNSWFICMTLHRKLTFMKMCTLLTRLNINR